MKVKIFDLHIIVRSLVIRTCAGITHIVQSVLNSSVSLKYENGIKGLKLSIEHYQSLSLVIACKLRTKMSSEKLYIIM